MASILKRRHGLDTFALSHLASSRSSEEFVAFLADVVATQSADKEIQIIVDNLSAHKTKRVVAFLAEHQTSPSITHRPTLPGSIRRSSVT